jgi:hypothetical protein
MIAKIRVFASSRETTMKNLTRMIQFSEVFPDEQIVVTLLRQLSWNPFLSLIPLKKHLMSHAKPRSREEK